MTAQAVHEVGSNSRERAGKITRAVQDGSTASASR